MNSVWALASVIYVNMKNNDQFTRSSLLDVSSIFFFTLCVLVATREIQAEDRSGIGISPTDQTSGGLMSLIVMLKILVVILHAHESINNKINRFVVG